MILLSRVKSAARILIKVDPKKNKRDPIPAITPEEVAEIKQFLPREKFFIFGHACSGTTLLMHLARLHPEVHCNYQVHFFTRQLLLKSLVNTPETEEWLTFFLAGFRDQYREATQRAKALQALRENIIRYLLANATASA